MKISVSGGIETRDWQIKTVEILTFLTESAAFTHSNRYLV